MNDDYVLKEVLVSGRRAPNGEEQKRQYLRLVDEGFLRRIPVRAIPGDTGDPVVCELTAEGKQRIADRG